MRSTYGPLIARACQIKDGANLSFHVPFADLPADVFFVILQMEIERDAFEKEERNEQEIQRRRFKAGQ